MCCCFVNQPQHSPRRAPLGTGPRQGREARDQIDRMRGKYVGTLSQTLPLIDEALLSPPARLPVDVLYINLSRCSALTVTAPSTTASINPLYPSSHQSIKAPTPPFIFILSSQTLHFRTSWPLRPPSSFLSALWSLSKAHHLLPGPFRAASPFSPGVCGVFVRAPAHCFTMTLHSIKVRSAC